MHLIVLAIFLVPYFAHIRHVDIKRFDFMQCDKKVLFYRYDVQCMVGHVVHLRFTNMLCQPCQFIPYIQ